MNNLIGQRLKELRNEKGINQQQLADFINTSRSNISKFENGTLDLSTDLIIQLSNYFKVSTDYLLCLTDVPEQSLVVPTGYYNLLAELVQKNISPDQIRSIIKLFDQMR